MAKLLRVVRLGPVAGTINPVSIEDVRSFIRLSDPGEDGVIAALLETAVARVEDSANIAIRKFSYRAFFSEWGTGEQLVLPRPPLVAVNAVSILARGVSVAVTGWASGAHLWPGVVLPPDSGWPVWEAGQAMQVDFVAGPSDLFNEVPRQAKDAVLLLAANAVVGREGTTFESIAEGFIKQLEWGGLPL